MNHLLADLQLEFGRHRQLAERAMAQLDDDAFFRRPAEHLNPVALVVKHLAGNLQSRWTNLLGSDGDKPSRNRDNEFVVQADDSRANLMSQWAAGWSALEETLKSLKPPDLQKTITIRGEPHSVQQALLRGLSHAAYHTGQILYLARLWNPEAPWLTIAPGQSSSHKPSYRSA